MKPKFAHFVVGVAILLFFHKYIFWDQAQRGLYRAYNEVQSQTASVPLKDYIDGDWDGFCVVHETNGREPLYNHPIRDGVNIPDLGEDKAWAMAFIKDGQIFQISTAKDVYEDNTQKCFKSSAKMKLVPMPPDTIPRPHIIFEN